MHFRLVEPAVGPEDVQTVEGPCRTPQPPQLAGLQVPDDVDSSAYEPNSPSTMSPETARFSTAVPRGACLIAAVALAMYEANGLPVVTFS